MNVELDTFSLCLVTTEYPATIVIDLTAHLFLKNDQCAGINYRQLRGILWLSCVLIYYLYPFESATSVAEVEPG